MRWSSRAGRAGSASIDTARDGVVLTLKNLNAAFDKAQIVEIDPLRAKYDPAPPPGDDHDRIRPAARAPSSQVFQKGYLLSDRILRPALVAVAKTDETDGGADADNARFALEPDRKSPSSA